MMDPGVSAWLLICFVALPFSLIYRHALAGRSFWRSVERSILLTFAGAGPSVLVAVLLGPWMAILALCSFFWWQWRTVE